MRVLSGIQPTGRIHWGNYFGANRQYIDLQHGNEAYYFIANLHALTTIRDPRVLRQNSLDMAIDLLSLGIDPNKATLFVQSDVPEISELCWILMTADILGYDADIVPVGQDQVQHIEVCRDIAGGFNHAFGEVFVLPKAKVLDDSAKVVGTDGEKMSKSYNNTIEVFEPFKAMRKKVMRIATDSRPMEEPKEPAGDHLYQLYSLFADEAKREEMAALYRRGGFGYGQVKTALADAAEAFFAASHARREQFSANPRRVEEILADGASRARKKAGEVLKRAKKACGL